MSEKKDAEIKLLQVRETDNDGKFLSKAVELNMLAEGKHDGDKLMRQIMTGELKIGDDPWSKALGLKSSDVDNFFEEISKDFDVNGIIDPTLDPNVPVFSEPTYIFTKPEIKEEPKLGLLGKLWMMIKKILKNM